MKRMFLIVVIVSLCAIVAIGGNVTFVMSNSVLKQNKPVYAEKTDVKVLVDLTENKLYLMNKNKMLKSYPLIQGKETWTYLIGDWTINYMEKWDNFTEGYWMGLNVPWGTFGIQGNTLLMKNGRSVAKGSIRLTDKYAAELYAMIEEGTPVKVYGGPYGVFGKGYRTLNYGDNGSDVYEVEKKLKEQGYYKGSIEGMYNEALRIAIHTFQKDKGLEISDVIGKVFYEKLGIILIE